ncbi:hypothetical protein OUZ56_003613 [Daphnia magna]|uniref:Uncharacterized protein n=1 Tax=Daphnia magna TaxID=35525 RepID=A0ABR0A9K7_9CRUS|nr:hypothetical protein OUZ56_003613 [Daphnia magna]
MAVTRYLATTNQRKNKGYDDTIWRSLLLLLRKPKYKIKQKQVAPTCSSLLAEEFHLLPEIRLLQGDEQQTIHKQ